MAVSENKLTGVVLAGGKSSRFGQDKGLYVYQGKPLVEHSLSILQSICNELFISTNKSEAYSVFDVPCIPDKYMESGPLGGIHSALLHTGNEKTAIISCDMPNIPAQLFSKMANIMGCYDLVIPVHEGFAETMCCIYSKNCLPVIEHALMIKKHKILDAIKTLNILHFNIDREAFYSKDIFHNINTKKDLNHPENKFM